MKKITTFLILLLMGSSIFALAQEVTRPVNIALQGGVLYSVNENTFSYKDNGQWGKLFTPEGGIAIGYDFSHRYGARLAAAYGLNRGAGNVYQTAARGFYPYDFQSINIFADAIIDLGKATSAFSPKIYGGVGGAHTFGFSKPTGYGTPKPADNVGWEAENPFHPWQDICEKNTVFGFRAGFIAQYDFNSVFGIYCDLGGEAYLDDYNGLRPTKHDQADYQGYAGFPLDLRAQANFGVIFHF